MQKYLSLGLAIVFLVALVTAPHLALTSNARTNIRQSTAPPKQLEWQLIQATGFTNCKTYRAMVPGGWLVSTAQTGGTPVGTGTTFVPDPDHSWNIQTIRTFPPSFYPKPIEGRPSPDKKSRKDYKPTKRQLEQLQEKELERLKKNAKLE